MESQKKSNKVENCHSFDHCFNGISLTKKKKHKWISRLFETQLRETKIDNKSHFDTLANSEFNG
jgi:hypothetical protein